MLKFSWFEFGAGWVSIFQIRDVPDGWVRQSSGKNKHQPDSCVFHPSEEDFNFPMEKGTLGAHCCLVLGDHVT